MDENTETGGEKQPERLLVAIQDELCAVDEKPRWESTRDYVEKHPVALALSGAVTVGAAFVGLVLSGWPGVLVGLILGGTSSVVGLRASRKVREIHHGS